MTIIITKKSVIDYNRLQLQISINPTLQPTLSLSLSLFKVKQFGINGNFHNWINNWLSNRKQRIVINDTASDWAPVTNGIPEGSLLGPVLSIIYINDIDVCLNNLILNLLMMRNWKLYNRWPWKVKPWGRPEKNFKMVRKVGNAL